MKHAFVLSLYATMVKHPQWYQCGSSVAQLSPLFAATWIAVPQASLSLTVSRSLLKLMSTESLTPSNRLTFCRPLLLLPSVIPSIRLFSNESALCFGHFGGQSIGVSALASVLPINIQD